MGGRGEAGVGGQGGRRWGTSCRRPRWSGGLRGADADARHRRQHLGKRVGLQQSGDLAFQGPSLFVNGGQRRHDHVEGVGAGNGDSSPVPGSRWPTPTASSPAGRTRAAGARSAAVAAPPDRSVCAHGQARPPHLQRSDRKSPRLQPPRQPTRRICAVTAPDTCRRPPAGAAGRRVPRARWCSAGAGGSRCRPVSVHAIRTATWLPSAGCHISELLIPLVCSPPKAPRGPFCGHRSGEALWRESMKQI
ncbi:hypothetical protein QFZ68_007147 [Streptomyces sp. V1I6]|nr:hypothetical protein [Streptomyces sp. V1I6]